MMKPSFLLFFGIFFALYGLVNYYIFLRGLQAIPAGTHARIIYIIIFLIVALSFIAGRTLENYWLSPLSGALVWVGSFWLAAMLYFVLGLVVLDLLRLANYIIPFTPSFVREHYAEAKLIACAVLTGGVLITLFTGHLNALRPEIRKLSFSIPKKVPGTRRMKIAAASDIHLGTIIGRRRLDAIVEEINRLDADLVLLPGDVVDEDLAPVIKENLGESLRKIRSRYGVYAVTGNHEYIGGAKEACAYLEEHGIRVLRDTSVTINGLVTLVGREDRSMSQFLGKRRKPLAEIMAHADTRLPVILMDHQPFHLEEGAAQGADLQLSGHTHHGQLWPFNYITRAVYEVSWGERQIGNTHVYVSCGVGTWGPPVRTGNRPEILDITLEFLP
jgi:predicted MPP superfamily phosphohydrolase